ncbi:hypothetical protein JXA47_15260 [Candidatus Sumerlaeota bacterium]|nr:hypothetical protein [Candidatus Sumerlaeota bacterium]
MALRDNPEFMRGIRRLRFWEGRWSPTVVIAPLAALAGLLVFLVGRMNREAGQEWASEGLIVICLIYLLIPLLIPLWLTQSMRLERRTSHHENLAITPMIEFQIESGKTWALVLPFAPGAAIGLLLWSIAVDWNPTGWPWVILITVVMWILILSQLHFTLLFTLAMGRDPSASGWTVLIGVASLAWALDLCVVGLLLKPLFCVMHLVDSLSRG